MFLTQEGTIDMRYPRVTGRNPLKSGQCFLLVIPKGNLSIVIYCRNPLKSGQCFLPKRYCQATWAPCKYVAIPSNRVNVSYLVYSQKPGAGSPLVAIPSNRVNVSYLYQFLKYQLQVSRNPLKSGQCFLLGAKSILLIHNHPRSQSPQIGSMFLTGGQNE